MSRAVDLTAIDATVEIETVTFDFGKTMQVGKTILSAAITCIATLGIDGSASSRIVGLNAIIASPSTGEPSAAVMQMFGNMIAGETYRLSCQATINDGQKLNLWTHLPCVAQS